MLTLALFLSIGFTLAGIGWLVVEMFKRAWF